MQMSAMRIRRMDDRQIANNPDEIRLFVMGRNESLRLPYFFEYYFSKGVDRVFYIDNGSTDQSMQIALGQENVHVFQTRENFKHYSNWMEILLERYGKGHWCLAADVDEILNYPYADVISLKEYCHFLESQGYTAVQNYLLDMYSDKPVSQNAYTAGENPLAVCSYFDPAFEESEKYWLNEKTQEYFPLKRITGNLRYRLFGTKVSLSKINPFKYGPQVFAGRGLHAMDGVQYANLSGVVFHFKYLQDFNARVVAEARRGQHEGGAAEYKKYARKVEGEGDINCYFPGSVRYENNAQLREMGLIKSSTALDAFIQAKTNVKDIA